jgi:hypothetical protein
MLDKHLKVLAKLGKEDKREKEKKRAPSYEPLEIGSEVRLEGPARLKAESSWLLRHLLLLF